MSEQEASSGRKGDVRREWTQFGSALAMAGLLVGYMLYAERTEIDAQVGDRLKVQARVITENLGRQIEGVDKALTGIRDALPTWDKTQLAQQAGPRLTALSDAMPGVRSIHILDAQGHVLATSRDTTTVGRSFADRELFTAPRDHPERATLYVSPPYKGRREQVFTVNLGHALTDAGGHFAGVVTAALDPEFFEVLLRSGLYAPDMRTAVLHGDGTLFLYVPTSDRGVGTDRSGGNSFFARHRDSGQTESLLLGTSTSTGDSRMVVMRTMRGDDPRIDKPLVVAVSREMAAVFLPWWRQVALYLTLLLLFAGTAGLSLLRYQRRREELGSLALAREAERRDGAERLELALAGADLGLWDWHVPTGKVVFNSRWFTMLGYEAAELGPGPEAWRTLLHPDDAQRAESVIDAHLQGNTPSYELEHRLRHKDGQWRWIHARGRVVQRAADGTPVRMVGTHMDISARKAADAALRDSHAMTQQVIDNLPHGFATRDTELRYRRWNPMMEALTGVDASQVIGKTSAEVFPDLAAPLMDSLVLAQQRALAGEIVPTPDRLIEREGKVYWTSAIHGPLRDATGRIIGTISSVQDISARKQAEQALRKSEEDLAVTLQSIGDAVIATDTAGRLVRMNASAERLTGWTLAQASAKPLADVFRIVNAQTRESASDPVQLVLERGEVVGLANHTVLVSRDGVEHHIADSAAPIRDAQGQVTGVVLVFSDVSEAYRTQQALKASESRFRAIFEASPECIMIIDASGRVVDINAAGLAVFEAASVPELQQHSLFQLITAGHRHDFGVLQRQVLAGAADVLEYQITGLQGTPRWLQSHAAPLHDGVGEPLMLVITRDITRRKRAQAERSAMHEQLREAQRMEAIGTLAGGIAHDFNNILGAISGNAVLALQDVGADHPAALSLGQITKASLRARDMVRQILTFSRGQPPARVPQPLQPLIREAIALLSTTLPAVVQLEAELAAPQLYVNADGTQIEQVLLNLCTNAWHALQGSSGRIVIGLVPVVLDTEAAARLGVPAPGPYARLWVTDTGSGIDAATRSRIFEPFFTTKPTGTGTGLGLSVVHGIVGAHQGAIAVESTPGRGSTFHVYLPLVEAPAEVAASTAIEPAAAAGGGQHVLYVDDDEVMALMVERVLQRGGYRATCFLSATDAVAAVRAHPAGFDLVVTDYNMPELSGLDVVLALADIRPELPVIISSGNITDELRASAQRLGVHRLLQKQNTIEELCALVHGVLAKTNG